MMNRYRDRYDRMGGRGASCGDYSPYRRPTIRNDIPQRGMNRSGGCGCGTGNAYRQGHRAENDLLLRAEGLPACGGSCATPVPARERTSCGCSGTTSVCGGDTRDRQRSCGCEDAVISIQCKKLMEQIRAVDFALYETILYLDVYPHSCDALETYRKLKAQREALHAEYEASCGPMTAFGNKGDSWSWMSGPFPWEYDAE